MPSTIVRIKNLALAHIGHSIFIADTDDDGNEPDVLALLFDDALAVVLEDFQWSFARRFATLGLVTDFTTVTTAHKWNFAYRYPVNAVTIRGIVSGPWGLNTNQADWEIGRSGPWQLNTNPADWEIGSDDTGRLFYTNQQDCMVEVTQLITDASLYPAMFSMAVSWYLAFLIVPALAQDKSIAGQMLTMYNSALQTASAKDANESYVNPQQYESEAMRARE